MSKSTKSCVHELAKYNGIVLDEICNLYRLAMRNRDSHLHRKLERRWSDMETFAAVRTIAGHVPYWESGRDCDCVQYGNACVLKCDTYWDYERHITKIYEDAEGPVNVSIIPTWDDYHEAKDQSYSRDLIAEATEDGHPHCVYG